MMLHFRLSDQFNGFSTSFSIGRSQSTMYLESADVPSMTVVVVRSVGIFVSDAVFCIESLFSLSLSLYVVAASVCSANFALSGSSVIMAAGFAWPLWDTISSA